MRSGSFWWPVILVLATLATGLLGQVALSGWAKWAAGYWAATCKLPLNWLIT
jgi:hypothetical protein